MRHIRDLHENTPIDRRINGLLIAVAIVVVGTFVIALLTYPAAVTGADNTEAQLRSDRISGCRASYFAAVDNAKVDLLKAQVASNELIRQGFAAVALGDDDLLLEIASQAAGASADIAVALERLDEASSRYAEAVASSRYDPDRFLDECLNRGLVGSNGPAPSTTVGLRAPISTTTTTEAAAPVSTMGPQVVVVRDTPASPSTPVTMPPPTTSPPTTQPPAEPDPPESLTCMLLGLFC